MAEKNTYKKDMGNRGEDIASSFLEDKGFEIIERNYRFKKVGEIDIIARKEELIVFVEVKNRNTGQFGGAVYSINQRKKNTIKKVAGQFLISNSNYYSKKYTCRFDLISIDEGSVEWHEDIFR